MKLYDLHLAGWPTFKLSPNLKKYLVTYDQDIMIFMYCWPLPRYSVPFFLSLWSIKANQLETLQFHYMDEHILHLHSFCCTQEKFNPFQVDVHFLCCLKASESLWIGRKQINQMCLWIISTYSFIWVIIHWTFTNHKTAVKGGNNSIPLYHFHPFIDTQAIARRLLQIAHVCT